MHSTGAKTEEGKLRSSQNALKHGMSTSEIKAQLKAFREVLELLPCRGVSFSDG